MPRHGHRIRTSVLSPEPTGFLCRIPVALADTHPHHAESDAVPVDIHVEAVVVARGHVTDLHEVTVVGQGLVTIVYTT